MESPPADLGSSISSTLRFSQHRNGIMEQDTPNNIVQGIAITSPTTFQDITSNMLQQPSFALLIKKVFEACSVNDVALRESTAACNAAEKHYKSLSTFARRYGVERAVTNSSLGDVILAAILSGLEQLRIDGPSSRLPLMLRSVLAACENMTYVSTQLQDLDSSDDRLNDSYAGKRRGAWNPRKRKRSYPSLAAGARDILREWIENYSEGHCPTDVEKFESAQTTRISTTHDNQFSENERSQDKRKAIPVHSGRNNALNLLPRMSQEEKWQSAAVKQSRAESLAGISPAMAHLKESAHSRPRTSIPPFSSLTGFLHSSNMRQPQRNNLIASVNSAQTPQGYLERVSRVKFGHSSFGCSTNSCQAAIKKLKDPQHYINSWVQSHIRNPRLTKEELGQIIKFSKVETEAGNPAQ